MIQWLAHRLIPHAEDMTQPQVRQRYGMLCGLMGIALNLLLFAGKFLAGTWSQSIAITADAFNNLSDAGSSLITLLGFRLAGQKPDPEHPFGHGRMEYLSGLIVAGIILLMGFELLKTSVGKVVAPEPVDASPIALVILLAAILCKLYMARYNRVIGDRIHSAAMRATAADSLSDGIATTVVLLCTLFARVTGIMVDGWCGLAVSGFILLAGIRAAKETIDPLLGQAPDPDFVARVEQLLLSHEGVQGIHDLVVHDYGPGRCMLSVHAEVSAEGDILALHDLIDNLERELAQTLGCHAVIHMDPIASPSEETLRLQARAVRCLQGIDPALSLHDFRVVTGPTHTNLVFDVVAPYAAAYTDQELKARVAEAIHAEDARLYAVITVDRDFTHR